MSHHRTSPHLLFLARIASLFLRAYFTLRYRGHVYFGTGVILNHRFSFRGRGCLTIGDHVNLWAHEEPNRFFTYKRNAHITIGAHTRLNGVTIQSATAVTIENHCDIASAILMDTDFHAIDYHTRNDVTATRTAPILIKKHVWLAGQCAILKGVTVGEGSVVGFRAVVTKDVPPNVVVAGNPAMIVKEIAHEGCTHSC